MRLRYRLSAKQIAQESRVGVHADGGGLYLRIRENGSRAWILIYTFAGKRREMRLGSDYDVSLARARQMADAARALIFDRIDPLDDRRANRAVAKPVTTFGEYAMQWLDGGMTMAVISAVAEFERDLLIERTQAGLTRARAEGKALGRPSALSPAQQADIQKQRAKGVSLGLLAEQHGVSRATIQRAEKRAA